MEEYQILNTGTLVETYETPEIFEDIEVVGGLEENNNLDSPTFDTSFNKRKYSFVWQYFRPVEGTGQFQCLLCQSCVGSQTSNLARHLTSTHDISSHRKGQDLVRIRPSRSFIWKYCTKEDSKHARCHLCNKVLYFGGGNTANITKHLRRVHLDLIKEQTSLHKNASFMDDETMQATASLDQSGYEEEDQNGRSSADITAADRKERRGASYVWNYCEKLSRHTIRCKLCTKVMSFHGTANVITHLQRRHNVLGEPGSQLNNKIEAIHPVNSMDNGEEDDNVESSAKKFARRSLSSSSVVWRYCTRISSDQVRCCFCKKNLSYQGTSNLQRHLHRMHGVVTHGRITKPAEEYEAVNKEERFKLPANIDFIWEFCTQLDGEPPRTKCSMCDDVFDTKDTETIVKHLAMVHSVETNPVPESEGRTPARAKKRTRHVDFETSDDGHYGEYYNDSKWSKIDETEEDQQLAAEFDEGNIKKDESLYDELIEEDHNTYDEEPFDPSLMQDMPQANPLSPQSSSNNSPRHPTNLQYQQPNGNAVSIPNVLPPVDIKVLQKLQEDRLRMETEYFREKAGFYRMQKYLTALQAKKTRFELERLSQCEQTVVTAADLNGAYAVEVSLPEHHITTQ